MLAAELRVGQAAAAAPVDPTIPVGTNPVGLAFVPSGDLYVTNSGSNNVTLIDTTTDTVAIPSIPEGGTVPVWLAVAPNGHAYIPNNVSNNVSVLDTATNSPVGAPIPLGGGPAVAAVVPSGNVYVTQATANTVSLIDTNTNAVVGAPIPVGLQPITTAVAVNGKVYVANIASADVSVIQFPPTLSGISPAQGPTSGGTVVTTTGTNLTGATVTIGGIPATDVSVDPTGTQLTATTPPGTAGPATVTVTTPGGSASLVGGFTYLQDETSLTATPALAKLFPPHVYYPVLSATLTDLFTGLPVAGQPTTFSTGTHVLGTAYTDAQGTARLDETITFPLILTHGGYDDATFAGSPDLLPASAHGEILTP
ncbi:YncE family protein [Streptomyces sp. N2A]|uniref:YncE family protein n=1 Tax=Streptomyces sp. N2A TaxID=3073936 RepID=UPI0028706826|nr:YncE family protein [Streptomyces sp. N2A]